MRGYCVRRVGARVDGFKGIKFLRIELPQKLGRRKRIPEKIKHKTSHQRVLTKEQKYCSTYERTQTKVTKCKKLN